MKRRHLLLSALPAQLSVRSPAATGAQERADWAKYFSSADAQGTVLIHDARSRPQVSFVVDAVRAARRYTPASTFKIPHSLFALDSGIVRDEFEKFPWDGVKRSPEAWNADQDLRSAMRNSTVWVFERVAAELGVARETKYLQKIGYGNAVATGAAPFWVEGDLAISAHEQLGFLRLLYDNRLPFRVEHQRLVKEVMITEAGKDWIIRAKTGWSGTVGWWVGWVEWPEGPVFFAMNILALPPSFAGSIQACACFASLNAFSGSADIPHRLPHQSARYTARGALPRALYLCRVRRLTPRCRATFFCGSVWSLSRKDSGGSRAEDGAENGMGHLLQASASAG